ncbi:MAG TPA: hypothetical protein VN852_07420 [Candidatus Krumholzibacteria bacterium]|nr:hypothetical protein [Candidatus Krumholzibacteria bacterium]
MKVTSIGIVFALAFLGCATPPAMESIRTPGAKNIPLGIVLHPLLSTQTERGWMRGSFALDSQNRESIYIMPPAKTTMQVTERSERLTNMLNIELSRRGFKLRELPVEATPAREQNTFAVSLALLDELRERNDVHAILIGNAFFTGQYNDSYVTDMYVKVVNVETLEVMCQIIVDHHTNGWSMPDVVNEVADELAFNAGLEVEQEEQ